MIYLFSDDLSRSGGIETYLHALALHLKYEGIAARVVAREGLVCPLLDELLAAGVPVYRVPRIPGDSVDVRRRWLLLWLWRNLRRGDWLYCVRQPHARFYHSIVRLAHWKGARVAASWMLTPEFLEVDLRYQRRFCEAVAATDAVISVSRIGVPQYRTTYGYTGEVKVVPYHNQLFFDDVLPLPPGPPWRLGYMGRIDRQQKNLDQVLQAFAMLHREEPQTEFHFWGRGPEYEVEPLRELAARLEITEQVFFRGEYDHRRDLARIVGQCHVFTYLSRAEGGPCFTLLELMQAGRFCLASNVGGIPDLYAGHPELGSLVDRMDSANLANAMREALDRLKSGRLDATAIRQRYLDHFSMKVAHRAWLAALGINR